MAAGLFWTLVIMFYAACFFKLFMIGRDAKKEQAKMESAKKEKWPF